MVTAEQNTKNLATASDIIAGRQGIDPKGDLTDAQRVAYENAFAQFIVARPNDFTPQSIAVANEFLAELARPDVIQGMTPDFSLTDALGQIAGGFASTIKMLLVVGLVSYVAVKYLPGAIASANQGKAKKT
jgi:hypothetical protein